ncbi:hypothetical protein M569_02870, partial [Genlisea aurea]
MVVEPWRLLKMGNQVSSNLKQALYLENPTKCSTKKHSFTREKQFVGILSFEVANVMSKLIHLHKSLSESEVTRLRNEIFKSEGIRTLVCSDEKKLLDLAFAEKLDDLNRVAGVVSRLGKKCTIPALQRFQHVYGDIVSGTIDVKELSFLVKDMEGMIKKMERYVVSTANLYTEMEVMNELELATKKFQQNQLEESRKVFEQKLLWQQQDVSHLKDVSLWNQPHDKVVELLARTVCTLYARIHIVFGDAHSFRIVESCCRANAGSKSGHPTARAQTPVDDLPRSTVISSSSSPHKCLNAAASFFPEEFNMSCRMGPGRLLMDCLNITSASSLPKSDEEEEEEEEEDEEKTNIVPKSSLTQQALSCTVGGSALALHYANIIIVIEKLLRYPHLVGEEARDDLYQMLPNSLRKSLKKTLKSYTQDFAIYDAPLAHDWRERLYSMLKWLSPLAHNMIRWQSERNFEQQQIVTRTNVLLLQTIYFADRNKTETAVCELLVGLNYICRYEQQQNALLDCASSSLNFEDCLEWR